MKGLTLLTHVSSQFFRSAKQNDSISQSITSQVHSEILLWWLSKNMNKKKHLTTFWKALCYLSQGSAIHVFLVYNNTCGCFLFLYFRRILFYSWPLSVAHYQLLCLALLTIYIYTIYGMSVWVLNLSLGLLDKGYLVSVAWDTRMGIATPPMPF